METLGLLMNDSKNGTGRVARLELGGKWMCKEITFRVLFVLFQSIIKDKLKIWGWGRRGVSVRHGGVKRMVVMG
jgi:hypothetical protein